MIVGVIRVAIPLADSACVRYYVPMSTVQNTISLTQGRKRLFDIADEVQTPGVAYTLTSDGSPKVVLMSADEYESWLETLNVLSDFPTITDEVRDTHRAVVSGEWKKWSTIESLKKDWGMSTETKVASRKRASSKGSKNHGIRTRTKTISKKIAQ